MVIPHTGNAQNLIPNGSFEELVNPCTSPVYFAGMAEWSQPGCCWDPTYVSACYNDVDVYQGVPQNRWGYQEALEGQVYVGFNTYQTVNDVFAPQGNPFNYLLASFDEPLEAGQRYCLRLGLSLQDSTYFSTDNLNALFTTDTTWSRCKQLDTLWQEASQITFDISAVGTADWTLLEQEFIAVGGETRLILGNFQFGDEIDTLRIRPLGSFGGAEYAGYWLDDVRLVACSGVGVEEPESPPSFQILGSLVEQELLVRNSGSQSLPYTIHALDGRSITTGVVGVGDRVFDVAAFAEGVYVLRTKESTQRFVVAR